MEVTLCFVLNHNDIAQALSYIANGMAFMFFLESIRTFIKKATHLGSVIYQEQNKDNAA